MILFKPENDTTTYRVDFDNEQVKKTHSVELPENKKKNESEMESEEHTDLTEQQYEENYWKTTKESKLDGSTVMMETRISKCMEATGKSREECSKEVKARMKKAGSENTNTEDMEEKEDKEEIGEEEEKEDMDENPETEELNVVKIEKEKLDFLEKFYEENKDVDIESLKSLKTDFDNLKKVIDKYEAERAEKLEEQVNERISKYSKDFFTPEEEIRKKLKENGKLKGEKALKFIQDMEDLLTFAVKKNKDEEEGVVDTTDYLSKAEAEWQKISSKLRHT